jgi:hypothetical protein
MYDAFERRQEGCRENLGLSTALGLAGFEDRIGLAELAYGPYIYPNTDFISPSTLRVIYQLCSTQLLKKRKAQSRVFYVLNTFWWLEFWPPVSYRIA